MNKNRFSKTEKRKISIERQKKEGDDAVEGNQSDKAVDPDISSQKKKIQNRNRNLFFENLLVGDGVVPRVFPMEDSSEFIPISFFQQIQRKIFKPDRAQIALFHTLAERLDRDGYLFLKGFLNASAINQARRFLLGEFSSHFQIDSEFSLDDARLAKFSSADPQQTTTASVSLLSRQDLAHSEMVLSALEAPELYLLFFYLFSARLEEEVVDVATFDFKWLRAVEKKGFTGVHSDRVFFGNTQLHTAWIPLSKELAPEMGSLVVALGSHRSKDFKPILERYNETKLKADGTVSGWLTSDPNLLKARARWVTAKFQPGDVCILNSEVIHASATNATDQLRISCDTRWIPIFKNSDATQSSIKLSPKRLKSLI